MPIAIFTLNYRGRALERTERHGHADARHSRRRNYSFSLLTSPRYTTRCMVHDIRIAGRAGFDHAWELDTCFLSSGYAHNARTEMSLYSSVPFSRSLRIIQSYYRILLFKKS